MKKMTTAILVVFLLACLWTSAGAASNKKNAPVCPGKQTMTILYSEDGSGCYTECEGGYICIKNLAQGAKILGIKSSNRYIKAESMLDDYGFQALHVYADGDKIAANKSLKGKLKNGTKAVISFKVKQNNKTYNLSCKVEFKVQKTPLKNLKIGKKEYSGKMGSFREIYVKKMRGQQKISVKAAEGYKVEFISVSCIYTDPVRKLAMGWAKVIPNNSIVDMTYVTEMTVTYRSTKKPVYYTKPKSGLDIFSDWKTIHFQ